MEDLYQDVHTPQDTSGEVTASVFPVEQIEHVYRLKKRCEKYEFAGSYFRVIK